MESQVTEKSFVQRIQQIQNEFESELNQIKSLKDLEGVRIAYAGRKGVVSSLFKQLGNIPPEERKAAGQSLNLLKQFVSQTIQSRENSLSCRNVKQKIDITLPGEPHYTGRLHPLTQVLREIKLCFQNMGFSIAQGPEVESEYYNFEALNIPKGHPARDMHDTIFVDDNLVLRTHTSPVQIRVMENQSPPVRIIAPGRCYRRDTPDASHSPFFHQVEGLCVDKNVNFADLKGVILTFARHMFGSDMKIRFRPSFFPFTEPSAEYDFSCLICRGRGCRVCKGTGWVEISGAGMVNPVVFGYVGYDPEEYTGYAFGMGIERIAMLLFEIPDIRLFFENDMRFLNQF
ncbi:phenylalanine--tRNA ligase subunit alpha [bacterium]|nr:phenylalanine--tRNA ligase subunit alpha [bacterium]